MDVARGAVYGVVGVIVAVTLASGPLVGAVDLTVDRSASYGTGNATISSVELPDAVTIEQGRYGAESYFLRVPPAKVTIDSVQGEPFLVYRLSINATHYSTGSLYPLSPAMTGSYELALQTEAIAPDNAPEFDTSPGTLALILRSGHDETVLERVHVTVEVRS